MLQRDQPLFGAPGEGARRRGSVDRNVQLPIFAARRAGGCLGRWLEVGAAAWVCDDAVELSAAGPISPLVRTWREMPDGLPYRYYFVGPDGTFGYRRAEAADIDAPDAQLEPGFAVAIVEERIEEAPGTAARTAASGCRCEISVRCARSRSTGWTSRRALRRSRPRGSCRSGRRSTRGRGGLHADRGEQGAVRGGPLSGGGAGRLGEARADRRGRRRGVDLDPRSPAPVGGAAARGRRRGG